MVRAWLIQLSSLWFTTYIWGVIYLRNQYALYTPALAAALTELPGNPSCLTRATSVFSPSGTHGSVGARALTRLISYVDA